MSAYDDEILIRNAQNLARSCKTAGVKKNQVQQILAHLQRGRDVSATLELMDDLPTSCFAKHTGKTRKQFENLRIHVGDALRGRRDWREAARLLGWTCRCLEAERQR